MIQTAIEQLSHATIISEASYRAWFESVLAEKRRQGHRASVVPSDVPITAYINHGRWVIDCECGAGVAVHPDWRSAGCIGCGAFHTALVFPSHALTRDLLDVLSVRPARNRNWVPTETVAKLKAENRARDLAESVDESRALSETHPE